MTDNHNDNEPDTLDDGVNEEKRERIAKVMARSGFCSRREAEKIILQERVRVNDTLITSPATTVTWQDVVKIDGVALPAKGAVRLFRLHKPKGVLTTRHDPKNRQTLYDIMPPDFRYLQTVGRLDFNTEGLLLLTNDGGLKRYLELPETGYRRRYRVRMFGKPYPDVIKRLKKGVTIDGVAYQPINLEIERQEKANIWAIMTLTEGKNREIRKILHHFGYEVSRLIRISYGPFQLGSMPSGRIEEVPTKTLYEQFGKKMAEFV